MKKETVLLLALLTTLLLTGKAQDKIEWSDIRKLTVDDFKGTPSDSSKHKSSIVATGIETYFNVPEIKELTTFNKQVINYFYPDKSWILPDDHSQLTYFLTSFDINEWMARELRKRCNENRQQVLNGDSGKLLDVILIEFTTIQKQYSDESDNGNNAAVQMKWETKINERLASLADFCKTCL